MMRFFSMLTYPFLSDIYFPFKIWHAAGIKIRRGAVVKLAGRVTFGNPDASAAIVSRQPINLYAGKNAALTFGHSVSIGPGVNIIVKDNAKLSVGNHTYFTSDLHIEAVNSIAIGAECAISWGVTIIDDDHHRLQAGGAQQKDPPAVAIGNKVWIGCNVTILKNTTIGNNCVVAANSLVKGSFPDNCLIAGNPARITRENITWD